VRALIYELAGGIGTGALDVAGRPLLIRQLQWLRERGIEDVVVEVASGPHASARAALLLGTDPLTLRCVVIPTRCALGPVALADRAGLADDELFVALPANMVVHAELDFFGAPAAPVREPGAAEASTSTPALPARASDETSAERATSYALGPPSFALQESPAIVAVRSRLHEAESTTPHEAGWALRVGDPAAAHTLSCAILSGQASGFVVHAAEVRTGIWLARGARVAEDAVLVPPTLIGPDARVFSRARIGPNVVVGQAAVIEREAVLSEVTVAPGTLVGEASRVRQAQVDARGITSLADHARTELHDPLQLTSVVAPGAPLSSRALALCLGTLLFVPWLLGFLVAVARHRRVVRQLPWRGQVLHVGSLGVGLLDLVPALVDVVLGQRDLVGVARPSALEVEGDRADGPARVGALDLSFALAPSASLSTLLWMWRWYLQNKSARLDRGLLWLALGSALFSKKRPPSSH